MQDGSWNQPLPMSVLLKDPASGGTLEGDGGVFSEASSDGELYLDSATELDSGDGAFADLSAFLSADEINHSLDLAREAFGDEGEDPNSSILTQPEQVLQSVTSLSVPPQTNENLSTSLNLLQNKPPCPDENKPQDRPRLVHEGLELNDRAASAIEFCSRAATFIEELSSIFKGSAHLEQQLEEESSSPDSGYLSPKSQRPGLQGSASAPSLPAGQQEDVQSSQPEMGLLSEGPAGQAGSERHQFSGAPPLCGPLSPPQFLQKLKSQEVAEGCPIRLECRVRGNPLPLVRWFCEGRELQNSPDIQIWRDGDLHTLVITEAFEDDTGRYTCIASNSLGADNTSAEVYIEGASSSDSEGEGASKSRSGAMPQYLLQDAQASEGQVVVLECRVRGSPPLQVQWFRQGKEILDSPDFRILQKKPRSAAEPEEICTLVISEVFPEDGGLFCCTASNSYGSVSSTSQLSVTPGGSGEYKVSSFEQRLISEIEFRLERSPVEESDDDVQHDEDSAGRGVAPSFDQKLKHYKVFEGMPVTFSCEVRGDPKPKVYWFKDGKQISKRSEHYRISRDPDGTCFLHTAAASLDDDGNYTILAANPDGRVSCTGRMMVQAVNQRGRSPRMAPGQISRSRSRDSGDENDKIQERHFRPHFLQAPGDLIVQEGRLCRMDCKVSGLPTPDLVWQLNGQTIRPDSAHKMLVRENGVHSLVIEPVTSRDAGIYTCIASNRAGQNSFNLELIVAAKEMHKVPSFIEKLQNTSVAEGHPVRLECRVTGVPHPQIFWKRENESFTHNTDRISMHQDNCGYLCMIIQPALKEDAGWYTVSAKNEAGIVSSTARLDVHAQWQQPNLPKPKKVRPSTSRYAALTERGLDVKAAFFPDSSPLPPGGLVESEDL
uniref:Palladin n=1 Tax=Nothobranchius furzeri TaxID=105023 RepID=A0A8C6PS71_NOTFU